MYHCQHFFHMCYPVFFHLAELVGFIGHWLAIVHLDAGNEWISKGLLTPVPYNLGHLLVVCY